MNLKVYLYKTNFENLIFNDELEVGSFLYIQKILEDEANPENIILNILDKLKKIQENEIEIYEYDITPFTSNISINFDGNDFASASLSILYSDKSSKIFNATRYRLGKDLEKSNFEIKGFFDIVNIISNYDFIVIKDVDIEENKNINESEEIKDGIIFVGPITELNYIYEVDRIFQINISTSSIMNFLNYNNINTNEAIYNKLIVNLNVEGNENNKLQENQLKNIIDTQKISPFDKWFQDKKISEIIEIIFKEILFCKTKKEKKEKIDILYVEPDIGYLLDKIKKGNFVGAKFLILMHFIYQYIKKNKIIAIFYLEENKEPYILNILNNFALMDAKYEGLYSILKEISINLFYEFYEDIGSIIKFKPIYFNLSNYIEIDKNNNLLSLNIKKIRQNNNNIYTVSSTTNIIGDLGKYYILRSYFDFRSMLKYGANVGQTIVSPISKDIKEEDLYILSKLMYSYDISNLIEFNINMMDYSINNKIIKLNSRYYINIPEYIRISLDGYIKNLNINYSVDSIQNVAMSFVLVSDNISFYSDILKIKRLGIIGSNNYTDFIDSKEGNIVFDVEFEKKKKETIQNIKEKLKSFLSNNSDYKNFKNSIGTVLLKLKNKNYISANVILNDINIIIQYYEKLIKMEIFLEIFLQIYCILTDERTQALKFVIDELINNIKIEYQRLLEKNKQKENIFLINKDLKLIRETASELDFILKELEKFML